MPLILQERLQPAAELGLWDIKEEEVFFLERLELYPKEQKELDHIKGQGRRLEWLAGRYLLHLMSGRQIRGACYKDEFGKPHLENSEYQISISHSSNLAAVIAAPKEIGIDIQLIVEKIERIVHKFVNSEEITCLEPSTRLEQLHVLWGAKEALYKAYGRKELDFIKHIFIKPFQYNLKNGRCIGEIKKDSYYKKFDIFYRKINNYILVYAI